MSTTPPGPDLAGQLHGAGGERRTGPTRSATRARRDPATTTGTNAPAERAAAVAGAARAAELLTTPLGKEVLAHVSALIGPVPKKNTGTGEVPVNPEGEMTGGTGG